MIENGFIDCLIKDTDITVYDYGDLKNNMSRVTLENSCGYKYSTTIKNLKKNLSPKWFMFTNSYYKDNIKQYIKNQDIKVELLKTNENRLVLKCICGEVYECSWNAFVMQKQYKCKSCSTGMLSQNDLDKLLYIKKLKILKPIKFKKDNLFVEDEEGYRYKTTYNIIKRDGVKHKYHMDNPYSLFNVNVFIENNNIKTKLITSEYHGLEYNYEFKCECGNIFTKRLDVFFAKQSYVCNDCGHIITNNKNKHQLDYLYEVCINLSLTPLFKEYKNKNDKLLCSTTEGYLVEPIAGNLIQGHSYAIFDKSNTNTIYNIKLWLKLNNVTCELVSTEYVNNRDSLIFRCSCGKEFKCRWNRMYDQKVEKCNKCSKSQSSLESKIESLLIENNQKYIKEYRFDDCRYKNTLPFDFAVLDKNDNVKVLIECDGEQHYKPIGLFGGINDFEVTKIRDNIKNHYCLSNNIKLVRIPFWQFNSDEYINTFYNTCLM